jgi:hypothetical protein
MIEGEDAVAEIQAFDIGATGSTRKAASNGASWGIEKKPQRTSGGVSSVVVCQTPGFTGSALALVAAR